MLVRQEFEGHGRFYKEQGMGPWAPSVTTVLSFYLPMPPEIPADVLERTSARGTRVHGYIEHYLTFGAPSVELQGDDEARPFFESFLKAEQAEASGVYGDLERRLFGSWVGADFAGTIDLDGLFGDREGVFDWKTGRRIHEAVVAKAALQTAGYAVLKAIEVARVYQDVKTIAKGIGRYVLYLTESKAEWIDYDSETDIDDFLDMLMAYYATARHGGMKGNPLFSNGERIVTL